MPEATNGKVITALNEEAVACACLANKGGINLIHTYEAFGTKMYGALRQEIVFASNCLAAGRPQKWLSVPLILTSHTYENGKNEHSHQDPSLVEQLMGEAAHISRVLFPFDFNVAAAAMEALYQTRGQIWTMLVPKQEMPVIFASDEAKKLVSEGAYVLRKSKKPRLILTAIGAYQLIEAQKASDRLLQNGIAHNLIAMLEPRRFADPKNKDEAAIYSTIDFRNQLFSPEIFPRLFVTHTRAGRIQGLLQAIDTGAKTLALGYRNNSGTFDINGMLFVNGQSWAHIVDAATGLLELPRNTLLSKEEIEAVDFKIAPHGVIY